MAPGDSGFMVTTVGGRSWAVANGTSPLVFREPPLPASGPPEPLWPLTLYVEMAYVLPSGPQISGLYPDGHSGQNTAP